VELGWTEPIDQLNRLRTAVGYLLARTGGPRERWTNATTPLMRYRPEDYPERLRRRVQNLGDARVAVREDIADDCIFTFDRLSRPVLNALRDDIIALYEACLLDIGKGDVRTGYLEVVYPPEGEAVEPRPRPSLDRGQIRVR
jgi:hypothetical protein